jgi:hypothetical protein
MENVLTLERKSMADAIGSTMADRERFISSCARLAKFRWKAILIEASYEDMKTPYYKFEDLVTEAHPDGVAKFWLEPIVAHADSFNLNQRTLRELARLVEENADAFKKAWKKHLCK